MARLRLLPGFRHIRTEPSRYLIHYRRGRRVRSGRGLAFWFSPLSATLVEIPCDDRETAFLVSARAADYQDVHANGTITWRVADPEALADRVDFSIDTWKGSYLERPLDRLEEVFTHLAQRIGAEYVTATPVREALANGVHEIRVRLEKALRADAGLAAMGLEIVSVHVASVAPSAELEKALQVPTREAIQQRSDEATFQRRALAVEKERAIAENELANRIELARREETLIAQEGENSKRRATEAAAAEAIAVRAESDHDRLRAETAADVKRLQADAEAEGIAAVEGARVDAERGRMDIYRDLPAHVLLGLAAQEFAGKLRRIDRIQLTPDGIAPLLGDLTEALSRFVDGRTGPKSPVGEN